MMSQISRSVDSDVTVLGRRGTPHGPFRRLLRHIIHFFSYHLILSRQSIRTTRAAGFRLRVRPTVFHPRFFLSSEYFAEFLDGLDLSGKSVADIGTGSGILALAAARAGAAEVLALDVNPQAALSALENAQANGFGDRVSVAHSATGVPAPVKIACQAKAVDSTGNAWTTAMNSNPQPATASSRHGYPTNCAS